jgi:hypothetical protein
MEEHKRWYKSCAFVTGTSKNIPILVADRAKPSSAAPAIAAHPNSLHVPATADKAARVLPGPGNDAAKPLPLNSYLQSLGASVAAAPAAPDAAADQASSAAAAYLDAEIVYSASSMTPSPSRLLDDSFWSTPVVSAAGSDSSNGAAAAVLSRQAASQSSALKAVAAGSKQSMLDDADEELVVQHSGRRSKKKPSAKVTAIEPSSTDTAPADTVSAASTAKPPVVSGERNGHADPLAKAAVQARVFNLASACAETASVRADFDALRRTVKTTLDAMQQQLPTFALQQLDSCIAQPLMEGLSRLERASANIKHVQLSLFSRQAAQIELLKGVTVQVERRKSDLNVHLPFPHGFSSSFGSYVVQWVV